MQMKLGVKLTPTSKLRQPKVPERGSRERWGLQIIPPSLLAMALVEPVVKEVTHHFNTLFIPFNNL